MLSKCQKTLLACGDDICKVTGGKVLVHELVVAEQREHGLVLVGKKILLDTYVTRPGDIKDVLRAKLVHVCRTAV